MTQTFPIPSGVAVQLNSGPVYGLTGGSEDGGSLFFTLTANPVIGNNLGIVGCVVQFSGENITVRHNTVTVGTISQAGPFAFNHTATSTSNSLRFTSGGGGNPSNHLLAGLSCDVT